MKLMQLCLEEFIKWLDVHQTSQPTVRAVWERLRSITVKFDKMEKSELQEEIKKLSDEVTDSLLPLIADFRE